MSRACELLANKKVMTGNNVSHAKNRTRRRFLPNLHNATFMSKYVGKINLKVSTNAIRTVDKNGGIDSFLLNTAKRYLTVKAYNLSKSVRQKIQSI